MARATIDIQLTPRERALILRYGYPFDQIKKRIDGRGVEQGSRDGLAGRL